MELLYRIFLGKPTLIFLNWSFNHWLVLISICGLINSIRFTVTIYLITTPELKSCGSFLTVCIFCVSIIFIHQVIEQKLKSSAFLTILLEIQFLILWWTSCFSFLWYLFSGEASKFKISGILLKIWNLVSHSFNIVLAGLRSHRIEHVFVLLAICRTHL